jgi:hypothetical protein
MPAQTDLEHLSVNEFAEKFREEMVPLGAQFSYFSVALSLSEEDVREYLEDPIAALPPSVSKILPKLLVFFVPFLERSSEARRAEDREKNEKSGGHSAAPSNVTVSIVQPPESRAINYAAIPLTSTETALAFGMKEVEVADYHYHLYRALAEMLADHWPADQQEQYYRLLREELGNSVHGEIDEQSWHSKQALVRRQVNLRRLTKGFEEYARKSFVDTMTLYLHGICCDIDLEPGPRQLASRYIRRRLLMLQSLYPPPSGYAVFPEELNGVK